MRSAIYARVSTVTHSQPHTIEEQINRLRTSLLSRGQAAVVREVFARYLEEGASLSSIVNRLFAHGVASPTGKPRWRHTTVRLLLRSPAYTGTLYACRSRARRSLVRRSALQPVGKRHTDSATPRPREEWVVAGTIPALVTQERYELAPEKLARNRQLAARNNKAHAYLRRGLVSWGLCGLACTERTLKGYGYNTCAGQRAMEAARSGGRCRSRLTPVGQLDEVVWGDFCETVQRPELIRLELGRGWGGQWLPEELRARRASLRRALARTEQQLERLTEACLGGVIKLAEDERRRRELEEKADFEQKRRLVELLINRVIVTEAEVEIRYVIPTGASGEPARFCHLRTNYLLPLSAILS